MAGSLDLSLRSLLTIGQTRSQKNQSFEKVYGSIKLDLLPTNCSISGRILYEMFFIEQGRCCVQSPPDGLKMECMPVDVMRFQSIASPVKSTSSP